MKLLKKITWSDLRLLLILSSMIFLYSFSNHRSENRKIERIEVRFLQNSSLFISTETVNNLLIQNLPTTSNINKSMLDLNKLERELQKHSMVAAAEVYTSIDGVLTADVVQKIAIARVVGDKESHYIDAQGNDMPLSQNYSARVPMVEGVVNNANRNKITTVLQAIAKDEFLTKSITGIVVQPDQTLVMKSRNHNFDILFGRSSEVERKFANYKAFLHYASKDTLIETYKTINLKFTQQVVCTKF